MATYKGFSTITDPHKFTLGDFDLVKRDLLNHFNIRYGEKLGDPTFGCGIWDYLFEPMSEQSRQSITEEVAKVINYDPRVNARQIIVTAYEQGIQVEAELTYVNTDQTSALIVLFDRNTSTAIQATV